MKSIFITIFNFIIFEMTIPLIDSVKAMEEPFDEMIIIENSHQDNLKAEPTLWPLSYHPMRDKETIFYPKPLPANDNFLRVSDLHEIWYAEYGTKEGIPVLYVHGGPGQGCGPDAMRFFDPSFYRIILFDQRGAKRSKPFAEMRENTTSDLINDMEKLRTHLEVNQWLIFGGSWGTALSLAYGETHPDKCLGFILRGMYLATDEEAEKLWLGMGDHYPEAFDKFKNYLPEDEQDDLINSYNKRLQNPDYNIRLEAARSFMEYDDRCASALEPRHPLKDIDCLGIAIAYSHYSMNHYFLAENQIFDNLSKIKHLPAILVDGRFDTICRLAVAYKVWKNWSGSELIIVPDAGHSSLELGTISALVHATNKMRSILLK